MIAPIKCPSRSPVEVCAVLGFNNGKDGLTILDGCDYCNERGQCHYRGKPRKESHSMLEHRKEHKEPGEPEDRKERKERRRVQVSLHIFLGGGGA